MESGGKILPVSVIVCNSVVHEDKQNIKPQCVTLVQVCSASIHHLLTFLWCGNMTSGSGWSECGWIHWKHRSNRSGSCIYSTAVQTGSQLMKWNVNTQFVYANEQQSRRAGREARRHVRLQNSASFQTQISDVKQTVCVHVCVCVRACVFDWQPCDKSSLLYLLYSLFCLLLFIMNCCSQLVCDTLWKLPGPFHECSVIINWWNAALCIQPKGHHVTIKSQRFCLISE